jgi:hypothetical protein
MGPSRVNVYLFIWTLTFLWQQMSYFNDDNGGVISLRRGTDRGNTIVVNNAIDPAALANDVTPRDFCDEVGYRKMRIVSLIRDDRELPQREKDIALELIPLYSRCKADQLFIVWTAGILFGLAGLGSVIGGLAGGEAWWALYMGVPFLFATLFVFLCAYGCRIWAPLRIQELEQQLIDGRRGSVVKEPLLKEG